ncbi:MAG: 16S rRNA (adenine(1518)-N(6)/adenine(1519)-N(6))-dimethyltransferase RsmA [Spirochaetia bacterium]|nr:16S rRNA (adenine(1518)-N(6)/adenine(1519)-N(6))-dimethyltransferase RsmA [Spirochaetia bacterium]
MENLTATDVRRILVEQNAAPSKRRGQNFLIDQGQIRIISSAVLAHSSAAYIEIGPGLGALTRHLLVAGKTVHGIEIDRAFCRYLRDAFSNTRTFHLIEGDALEILASWKEINPFKEEVYLCGNLPYSISTDLLRSTALVPWIPGAVFLTQLEFADRITTPASLSSFAVYMRNFGSWKRLARVGKGAFFPAPTVDSALIEFTRTPVQCIPEVLEKILRSSFQSRRKKLSNSWRLAAERQGLDIEVLLGAAEECSIDTDLRAEEILDTKYYELTRAMSRDA